MEPVQVHGHEVNGLNDWLTIDAVDDTGPGGANHLYRVHCAGVYGDEELAEIRFQYGPIAENAVNGVSNEALLAIVRHRLQCFQAGPYSCRENALALTKIEEALHWLLHRTRKRAARGVEGTSRP